MITMEQTRRRSSASRVRAMQGVDQSPTPLALKRQIVADAWRFFRSNFPTYRGRKGVCFPMAISVIASAHSRGVDLILQAGTCYWRRVSEKDDNGIEPTHFGYEWGADGDIGLRLIRDEVVMPEIHMWAADPKTLEIVDLTTRYWPAQCESAGMAWKMPAPPKFIWTAQPEALYEPHVTAIRFAGDIVYQWTANQLFDMLRG